jgi:hypothetical protein
MSPPWLLRSDKCAIGCDLTRAFVPNPPWGSFGQDPLHFSCRTYTTGFTPILSQRSGVFEVPPSSKRQQCDRRMA